MGLFSRSKGKDGATKVKSKKGGLQNITNEAQPKPRWEGDAWMRTSVDPEEVQELLRGCTLELKSKALDMPFLLLPFRPTSDPSAARTFIRHFFDHNQHLYGESLAQELRLTEPMVLCSVVKWCWSRLPGGVVSWDAYELFKIGESDSNMARDSFATFIPLSVDSDARTKIIFDFFDLLSAIAAHGKTNGLGGRKLSRLAGWWAFNQHDGANGFDGGYKTWARAADAASHLFFAYLRSLTPASVKGINGISTLPMSLQKLVQETEYPPEIPSLLQTTTTRVVMIVNSVSPTPFALLRRTNHFQYRDDDRALQEFSEYEDPIQALTDECRRVLKSISTANQSQATNFKDATGLKDASWSRFEDLGFSGGFDEAEEDEEGNFMKKRNPPGLRTTPMSKSVGMNGGRPTTPSWADFLNSGFVDEAKNGPSPLLLPPDKILPPINTRGNSSQSNRHDQERSLEPGELASIKRFELEDTFWWVWISSLAGEEPSDRKASFGRCALVETVIRGGKWLVMEEMVKGAAPEPDPTAYIAEKKSFWGRSKKNKNMTTKSGAKQSLDPHSNGQLYSGSVNKGVSKTSIGPDQHARIQAAATQLQHKQRQQDALDNATTRRGRQDMDVMSQKTSSIFTLQPTIRKEASPAMDWANKYDKDAIKEAYLKNANSGRGLAAATMQSTGQYSPNTLMPPSPSAVSDATNPELLSPRMQSQGMQSPGIYSQFSQDRELPAVPQHQESEPTSPADLPPPSLAPLPPTPGVDAPAEAHQVVSEKAAEVSLPQDTHPIARTQTQEDTAPLAVVPTNVYQSDQKPSLDTSGSSGDYGDSSPESKKHNKLKKETGGGGLRKMFGRNRNRESKAPPQVQQNNGGENGFSDLQPTVSNAPPKRFASFRRKPISSPVVTPKPTLAPTPAPVSEDELTPVASPQQDYERSYDPSVHESLSRVDTNDVREANQAFSSFDQGPLGDVPTFIPDDSPRQSVDSAAPPPIKQSRQDSSDENKLTKSVSPVVGDRWAQIRKNAAQRAAAGRPSDEQAQSSYRQSEDYSTKTDGDDGETSGEETIESRVARIKARVAELTGNMEQNNAPPPAARGPLRR
ncbi:hypothetical protein BJ878DRAFT_475676 [Calycina marina]|uniref:Meiotically up-regulated protein Msb1/Mug8 domain-containing protein n=1 Tax=Calycina marina TaxID=1763456 RepID=A0A9P8CJU7_9HELO|nr:hypothetical protein BJ878DRAFT_475676 [Calycina marina]